MEQRFELPPVVVMASQRERGAKEKAATKAVASQNKRSTHSNKRTTAPTLRMRFKTTNSEEEANQKAKVAEAKVEKVARANNPIANILSVII